MITSAFSEKVYADLSDKNVLQNEQQGCKKDAQGMKDQLLINKHILRRCRKNQHNLAMGWIDYKETSDMVPHGWTIEALKMMGVAENIAKLIIGGGISMGLFFIFSFGCCY